MPRKKVTVKTDNSGWTAPKKRKPRKPMTEEQKAAAAKRLEKAREARAAKNPDYGKSSIHESLRNLPDEHGLSPAKVKKWIKTQKELAKSSRQSVRQKVKGAEAQLKVHEGYISSMQSYLRTGDWVDSFYGEYQEHKIRNRCIALAYDKNGNPKRNVGTYYPDMGEVYTQEMFDEERGVVVKDDGEPKPKRGKRNKRTVAKKKSRRSK
jgi:hypothetical protein